MRELVETTIDRPGCRLHLRRRESADGRWAVLCHGAGMDGHMFDAQLAALPDELGLCVWDARGHARSMLDGPFRYQDAVEDLHALCTSLAADDLTLIGQSMGGNLAQSVVALDPAIADRMVLIDCTDNHAPRRRSERTLLASVGPMLRVLPWRWTVQQSAAQCGTEQATRDYAAACLQRMGRTRLAAVMGAMRDALAPDPAYRLPLPTLLVVGAEDRSGDIASSMPALAAKNPGVAQLDVIADAAHNANMDRPSAVNQLIRTFLETRLV